MKKIIITRDAKFTWLLSIYFLINEISLPFDKSLASVAVSTVFVMAVLFLIYILLLKKITEVITLRDENFTIGLTGSQTASYEIVSCIGVTDKINVHFRDGSRSAKIKVMSLERNEAKYREFLDTIHKTSNLKSNTNDIINVLKERQKTLDERNETPAFKGWLLLLVIYITGKAIASGLGLILTAFNIGGRMQELGQSIVIIFAALFVLGVCVLILIFSRNKKTPLAIITYECISFMAFSIYSIIRSGITIPIQYANLILSFGAGIVFVLALARYIKISNKVRRIFVFDRIFEYGYGFGDFIKVFFIALGSIVGLFVFANVVSFMLVLF